MAWKITATMVALVCGFLALVMTCASPGKTWQESIRPEVQVPYVVLRQRGELVVVHLWDDSMMDQTWRWRER